MDTVLHIEPIVRQTPTPMRVGHQDYFFYGESLTEDDENVGTPSSHIPLGCPLESWDVGSTQDHIPLIKTIECRPDDSRSKGFIYSENLYYFKDRKFLIPYRTKLKSGLGVNLRLTHLPGLNYIRETVTGLSHPVIDPRSEIVSDIILRDQIFEKKHNKPLKDWITEDLTTTLSMRTANQMSFSTQDTADMVNRYIRQIHSTPHEYTPRHIRDITHIITPEISLVPPSFQDDEALSYSLANVKNRLMMSPVDFTSFGSIPLQKLERIEYNPVDFQEFCEFFDHIQLTDFNIDLVVTPDNDIAFHHVHFASDRFGGFRDHEYGVIASEAFLLDTLDGHFLNTILQKFVYHHNAMTNEIEDLIFSSAIKIKLIKTLTDEAAILLYRYDSDSKDPPLCGVYFDIALQALAPMTITAEPLYN